MNGAEKLKVAANLAQILSSLDVPDAKTFGSAKSGQRVVPTTKSTTAPGSVYGGTKIGKAELRAKIKMRARGEVADKSPIFKTATLAQYKRDLAAFKGMEGGETNGAGL